jgi:hypothetical protein
MPEFSEVNPFRSENESSARRIPQHNPSRMRSRRVIRGTDIPVARAASVMAGLALMASGAAMTVDAAEERFGSRGPQLSSGVIVEPVRSSSTGEVPMGAHPQKTEDQTPKLTDTRIGQEANPQLRVSLVAEVFPNLPAGKFSEVNAQLDKVYAQMERDGVFGDMQETIRRYDSYIDRASKKYNISKDILYGVFITETSGNLDAMHDSDALGPGIMPGAAEDLGIALSDRNKPDVAFDAMAGYLAKYREIFGDNLAALITNYYAGPGNTGEMLRVAAAGRYMGDPGELMLANYPKYREVAKVMNFYDVLNDPGVRTQVLSRLDPHTSEYVFRAMAGAKHYRTVVR